MRPFPAPLSGDTIVDYINRNWRQIDCAALQAVDTTAMIAAILAGDTAGDWASAAFTAIQISLEAAWAVTGCGMEEMPEWPDDPYWWDGQQCQKVSTYGELWITLTGQDGGQEKVQRTGIPKEIIGWEYVDDGVPGTRRSVVTFLDRNNVQQTQFYTSFKGEMHYWWIKPDKNAYCVGQEPQYDRGDDDHGPILVEPEIEECKWSIQPVDSYVDNAGTYHTKFAVSPSNPVCGSTFYYWSSQRGPTICPPEDPNCKGPDQRGSEIPRLPGFSYYLYGNCEKAEDWGEDPEDFEQPVLKFSGDEKDGIYGLKDRLDALGDMVSWLTLLQLQTCGCSKAPVEGDWVTTRWISDETMDHSGARLRKLFRYRTKSTRSLAELSEYWRSFTWRSGIVCVGHTGAWWGNPQVWAESQGEGKRVIRFAAAEAGIDPDQVGQWKVGSSRSPRYGMPGTMRIVEKDGFPWVASRDGSNWPNQLARFKPGPD